MSIRGLALPRIKARSPESLLVAVDKMRRRILVWSRRVTEEFEKADDSWQTPSLQNGWVNYGSSHAGAGYRKLSSGLVVVKGLVKDGTYGNGSTGVVFTLPDGYRPAETHIFIQQTSGGLNRVDVDPSGEIIAGSTTGDVMGSWLSLAGISFYADS